MDEICAYDKTRECDSKCVARVPVGSGNSKTGFTFPCERLDSMYDIANALLGIKESLESLDNIATSIDGLSISAENISEAINKMSYIMDVHACGASK
jgi:hypothetical protein